MKNHKQYKLLSLVLILAYVLSACSGVPALPAGQSPQGDQSQEVVFSGIVDAMGAGQWVVSGQPISFSNSTAVDANIQVGDPVKVEAVVDQEGNVTALRIESAGPDDLASGNSNDSTVNAGNSNDVNTNDGNLNDNASSSNDGNSNSQDNNANANGNDNVANGPEQEVSGMVQAITTESITINGVVYMISVFTEFKDLIAVGDMVKVHATANADGYFTMREIEKTSSVGDEANSNSNGLNDSDDSNENANSNDDDNGNDHDNDSDDDEDADHNENGSESNTHG